MNKKIIIICIVVIVFSTQVCAFGNGESNEKMIDVYINNDFAFNCSLKNDFEVPFRIMLENLGATVVCDNRFENIVFEYNKVEYVCDTFASNPRSQEHFYVKNSATDSYILLNPMGYAGGFSIENGELYLYLETFEYLLYELYYTLNFDADNSCLSITSFGIRNFLSDKSELSENKTELNDIMVELDGKSMIFDVAPVMESDRVLVPMRAIFEKLGASVEWEGETETVTATKDNIVITLQINNNIMIKNGEEIILDVPARLVGDRTLVPIRAIAEGLDATVDWIDEENKVVIKDRDTDSGTV